MEVWRTGPIALVATGSDPTHLFDTIDQLREAAMHVCCILLRRLPKTSGGDAAVGVGLEIGMLDMSGFALYQRRFEWKSMGRRFAR